MERDARQVLTELLVLRAQAGDERAFSELFEMWSQPLRRYATAKVGDFSHGEEVAQAAWITVARSLSKLDDPACFPRWIFLIVERRAIDLIRGRQRERRARSELEQHVLDGADGSTSDGLGPLRECIAKLDTPTRELLSLFYEAGLTVAEIATVQNVPAGTVKSRLFHARETLKRQLERTSL